MVEQDEILKLHAAHTGVLEVKSDLAVTDKAELGQAYTPGVAVISKLIAAHPELKAKYTMSGKLVALITDGSAVLGLGNIGPAGGLPVVEGKALLYKNLAGINAIPLALNQVSVSEMVKTIKNLSLSFAGIHLEDITAPKCFELEAALKAELNIPVYHDDQEGTAIVVLAGLINAAHVVGKSLQQLRVVVNGVGASGLATARLLAAVGVKQLTLVDVYGS
ncbi:malic enzyme, NAD-dependent [Lactiplantibacillus plantarum]|nr:malic enzyme, NAD-dependent [Lactiplantibacillus plantarum]